MTLESSLIGKSSASQTFQVTEEAVRRFMEATEDPALQNETSYVPPTFPTTFRMSIPELGLDNTKMQVLHGEQQYTYTRPLQIGEEVTCVVRVANLHERSGRSGSMTFIKLETTGTDSNQQPVFTASSTLVVRQNREMGLDKAQG
jgi:uncharacterized protein YprB with RNaseH-like and TPR domain